MKLQPLGTVPAWIMQQPVPSQHGPSGQESAVTSFGQVVEAVAWNTILNIAMPNERMQVYMYIWT